LDFVRAEEGSGEESARAFDLKFSENGDYKIRKHKIEKIYDFCYYEITLWKVKI